MADAIHFAEELTGRFRNYRGVGTLLLIKPKQNEKLITKIQEKRINSAIYLWIYYGFGRCII